MERSELLATLASRILAVQRPHPTRVAIVGVDAAGKTTLANELAGFIEARGCPVVRASIDGFHNPASIRHRQGKSSPESYYYDSFNYTALVDELLNPLGPGGTLRYRSAIFDFKTIFVDAAFEVTLARAMQRDLFLFGNSDEVRRRYEERYIPGQRIYLEQCQPKKQATIVVDNNDLAIVEMIDPLTSNQETKYCVNSDPAR